MSLSHRASNCRWVTPTLFMPAPYWFEAERSPWTCLRDALPRALATTEVCLQCGRWEPAPAPVPIIPAPRSRGHAPDAPLHQRVYPVPGIHEPVSPRVFIPHHHYSRPYYSFRPRFWLGFGLYLGYPLQYPLIYDYPTYIFDGGAIEILPPGSTTALYGGISFEIAPDDAVVLVDGVEVGSACDFSPTQQPLTLRPGRHHVELRARGMQPVAFDIDIVIAQVLPFSGVLQPR